MKIETYPIKEDTNDVVEKIIHIKVTGTTGEHQVLLDDLRHVINKHTSEDSFVSDFLCMIRDQLI